MNNTAAERKKDHVLSKGWFGQIWKVKVAYAFVLPYMILFMVFTVLPVLISIVLSFTSFNILQPPKFVFMENYVNLFANDDVFTIALKNTLIVAAISGPLSYLLSYLFAWMINELRPIVRSIVTLIFYAPSIVGNMYVIWTILFSGDSYGYINGFLIRLGIIAKPILWLKDPSYMMAVLIIIVLWSSLGTSFLAFIAGFQGVDKSLYEAAAVDGITNRWQELWYITLPSMRPQLMFGAVKRRNIGRTGGDGERDTAAPPWLGDCHAASGEGGNVLKVSIRAGALLLGVLLLFAACNPIGTDPASSAPDVSGKPGNTQRDYSCKVGDFVGKGENQTYTDPSKLYSAGQQAEWTIGETANFVDQLDSLRHTGKQEKVTEVRDMPVNTAANRTVLIAGESGGYLQYEMGETAFYRLEAIAPQGTEPALEVAFSADGREFTVQPSAVEETESLPDGFARYSLTCAGTPLPGNTIMRIQWKGTDTWLDTVQLALFNDSEQAGGHLLEMGHSENVVPCEHGYCIASEEEAYLVFYRNYLQQWKATLKYNGETPQIAVYVSEDNETYTEADWYATPSILSPEGYRQTEVYSSGQLPDNSCFIKVVLTKRDNTEGTDLHVTDVSLCTEGFTDPFETTFFMQEFTSNLKTRYVNEQNLVYAGDGGELSFVYQKNDITGFDLMVSYADALDEASLQAYVSADGKTYTEVAIAAFDETEEAAGLIQRYSPTGDLPSGSNYLKFVIRGSDGFGGYRPYQLRIQAVNDPVAELRRVSEVNGIAFSDIFSITHAAGGYTHSKENYLVEGIKAIEEMRATTANIFVAVSSAMPPSYVNSYPFNYSWDTGNIKTLVDLCESEPFKRAFSSETIDTFIMYVESPSQPSFKASYSSDSYQELLEQEYANTKAFAEYLLDTYRDSGKTFIIQTWESDWWVMEQSTYTYDEAAMERFQRWINNRQQAVEDARAAVVPQGVEVYNCLELICLDRAMQGMVSVINNIVPNTKCDMYAYSAYDTTLNEYDFAAALEYLREHTPPSEILGRDNLYIGEFGMPEMEFGETRQFHNALKTYKTAIKAGMRSCNYWQLYCNEPVAGKEKNNSHNNEDYRGFWLIRADGTKNQTYYLLKAALKTNG